MNEKNKGGRRQKKKGLLATAGIEPALLFEMMQEEIMIIPDLVESVQTITPCGLFLWTCCVWLGVRMPSRYISSKAASAYYVHVSRFS